MIMMQQKVTMSFFQVDKEHKNVMKQYHEAQLTLPISVGWEEQDVPIFDAKLK